MAFVKFETPKMGQEMPKVEIGKRGQININRAASVLYKLYKFEYAILYYDPDEKKVGVKLTNDELDPASIKIVRKKDGSCIMSAESFFRYFNLSYDETINFTPEFDEMNDMIILDLSKGL
jgi:hypothetical protein